MKTNINMLREINKYKIIQRTQDGYFDANYLLQQWNNRKGNSQRRISEFLNSPKTKEFIGEIMRRESKKTYSVDNQVRRKSYKPHYQIVNDFQVVIKMEGKTFSDGSKIPSSTWMHPLLFIDFAMYINPEFKYQVLKFVCDDMIKYRNEAGDNCNELKKVLSKYTPEEQMEKMMTMVSIGVNRAIFGIHKKGIRNMYPDEKIQKELADLEKKLIMLIEDGYIKNIFDLDNFFNKEYDKRWKKN